MAFAAIVFAWQLALREEVRDPEQAAYLQVREDHPAISLNGCHLTIEETAIPECVFGDRSGSTSVVLYGDSHAAQWFPALEAAAAMRNWRLVSITKMGCPAPDISLSIACEAWRREALARIRSLNPALVFVSSVSQYLAEVGQLAGVSDEAWSAGTRRTMLGLRDFRTLMLVDLPQPGFDPVLCLARRAWHPWLHTDCVFERTTVRSVARATSIERSAAGDLSHVRFLDLSNSLCPTDRCDPMPDSIVRYRDDNHISASFSRTLASALVAALDRLRWHWPAPGN